MQGVKVVRLGLKNLAVKELRFRQFPSLMAADGQLEDLRNFEGEQGVRL